MEAANAGWRSPPLSATGLGSQPPRPVHISGRAVPWQNRTVTSARFHLTFPQHLISEPLIHRVGKDFGLVTNIRRANIEEAHGWVILEMEGPDEAIGDAVAWLASQGVQVDRIEA